MLPKDYQTQDCSVARSLEIIGERWTLLIVREALFGCERFDEFAAALGIASNTLTHRLETLVEAGVLDKSADPNDSRRRIYRLTKSGEELGVVVEALREWGDRNTAGGESPPVSLSHNDCGGDLRAIVSCQKCKQPVRAGEVTRHEHRPLRSSK